MTPLRHAAATLASMIVCGLSSLRECRVSYLTLGPQYKHCTLSQHKQSMSSASCTSFCVVNIVVVFFLRLNLSVFVCLNIFLCCYSFLLGKKFLPLCSIWTTMCNVSLVIKHLDTHVINTLDVLASCLGLPSIWDYHKR